ncbi:MAG: exo-beta-1,3-glucanase [Methylovulum sp.]
MKHFLLFFIVATLFSHGETASARATDHKPANVKKNASSPLQCVAFSPYVGKINPNYGPQPSSELINELLDKLVKQTPFRCIMTYGVINGLDAIFAAAEARHIKVIAIIWLDNDIAINSQSITKGIEVAKAFPQTIIKLSCGSEVRTRNDYAFDGEISRCIDSLRKADVSQPITTIDIWWEWCNRSKNCGQTNFGEQVDWIGVNVYPWWENKYSGVHTCITAVQAADFHIARIEEIRRTYPGKEVIITEFGWPNGPEGGTETNKNTQQRCGIAGKKNQALVVKSTFKKLQENNWSGVVFEAFSENWKPSDEGNFGRHWGICQGEPPYSCSKGLIGN